MSCAIDFIRPRRRRPLRAAISRFSRDTMLSPTVRLPNSVAWRSAETKLLSESDRCWRLRARGSRGGRGRARSRPPSGRARAHPTLRRPAKATISPARTLRSMPVNSPPWWVQSRRMRAVSASSPRWTTSCSCGSRSAWLTTSSAAIVSWVRSGGATTFVQTPSRMIATRSACRTSSASRWETRMTTWPASARTMHAPEQVLGLLVGQRRVRLVEEARCARIGRGRAPISVRCWTASGTRSSGVSATSRMARSAISVALLGTQAAPAHPGALAADHQVLADREVREQLGLLVDHGDAILVRGPGPRAPRRGGSSPSSARVSAARILMSVDLPAPLGPAIPTISPGTAIEVEAVEGAGLAVPLAQPADDEAGLGRRALR